MTLQIWWRGQTKVKIHVVAYLPIICVVVSAFATVTGAKSS